MELVAGRRKTGERFAFGPVGAGPFACLREVCRGLHLPVKEDVLKEASHRRGDRPVIEAGAIVERARNVLRQAQFDSDRLGVALSCAGTPATRCRNHNLHPSARGTGTKSASTQCLRERGCFRLLHRNGSGVTRLGLRAADVDDWGPTLLAGLRRLSVAIHRMIPTRRRAGSHRGR